MASPPAESICIIPCRLRSSRLPRKVLLPGPDGRAMIEHVYSNAEKADFDRVLIAAEDDEMGNNCPRRAAVFITGGAECGTERAQMLFDMGILAAIGCTNVRSVCVLQADEPELPTSAIRALKDRINVHAGVEGAPQIVTLAQHADDFQFDSDVMCIPDGSGGWTFKRYQGFQDEELSVLRHIGAYAFTPDSLRKATELSHPFNPEAVCGLEQMEWVRAVMPIDVKVLFEKQHGRIPGGINTPDDYYRWLDGDVK